MTSAVACLIHVIDPATGELVIGGGSGVPDGLLDLARRIPVATNRYNLDILRRGVPFIVDNARDLMLANWRYEPVHDYLREATWDSGVINPMLYHGQPVGAIVLFYPRGMAPSPEERQLVLAVADQTALAIENVQLFTQSERRVTELEALTGMAANLTLVEPLDTTMQALAKTVVSSTPAIASTVALVDPDTMRPRTAGGEGLPDGYLEALDRAFADPAWPERLRRFVPDEAIVMEDSRIQLGDDPLFAPLRPYLKGAPWRAMAAVPLRFQDRTIGFLNGFYPPGHEPSSRDSDFLRALADQASLAIQNFNLFEDSERRVTELETLTDVAASIALVQPLEVTLARLATAVVDRSPARPARSSSSTL